MQNVLLGLVLLVGCFVLGCESKPPYTPPPPQDSGADKHKKALFPIPDDSKTENPKAEDPKAKDPKPEPPKPKESKLEESKPKESKSEDPKPEAPKPKESEPKEPKK